MDVGMMNWMAVRMMMIEKNRAKKRQPPPLAATTKTDNKPLDFSKDLGEQLQGKASLLGQPPESMSQ